MVDTLIPGAAAAKAAGAVLKILAPIAGALAIAAGGFAAAEVYEHGAPWGLGPKLTRAELTIGTKQEALARAAAALRQAAQAISARDQALSRNAGREAQDAAQTSTFWKGQANAAFNAGLAACQRAAGAPPGDVRDLRSLWSAGAYPGADRVPGEPAGPD